MNPRLIVRAKLVQRLRAFFERENFLEVVTPVRLAAPAPEEYIDCIPSGDGGFLRASPELEMKLLLGRGYERIYQLGPCFRADEHGWKHREEFTMLEFYAVGRDYRWLRDFTAQMVREIAQAPQITYRGTVLKLDGEPEVLTVAEAFSRYARRNMFDVGEAEFDELMVTRIEPELGRGRLTFLTDYPAERASLARLAPGDGRVAERWELYASGIELANAYGELTDGDEQLRRFRAAQEFRRARGATVYPDADEFLAMLAARRFPECSGCALGFDRLAMLLTDATDISEVLV